ncbi:MAG: GntR family transcriptional regulator [Alicyclobacillus sp.]|nr:GntR family transcriptional regulator [Alicyclobacillus sp.]
MGRHADRDPVAAREQMESIFSGIRVHSAAESVYRALLKAILTGKLARGQFLQQSELAEQLGVSRTPLREALMRLASMGLVQMVPNRGARVTGLDFGDMRHAWMARVIVEAGAAKVAASDPDPLALARMQRAVDRQREVTDDVEESLLVNRDFHLALVGASRNPYLIRFADMLWAFEIAVPIFGPQAADADDLMEWAADHQRIVDAIRSGDAEAAEALTRDHILRYPPPER